MKSQAEFLEPFKRERSEGKKRKGDKEGGGGRCFGATAREAFRREETEKDKEGGGGGGGIYRTPGSFSRLRAYLFHTWGYVRVVLVLGSQ